MATLAELIDERERELAVLKAAFNATAEPEPEPESAHDAPVLKSIEEQRYVLGLAYQAGKDARIAKGLDGCRDYISAVELEKAAWGFVPAGGHVGIQHVEGTIGAAQVVESYIYRGPDWLVGDTVIKAGDWLVGAILDEPAWQLHKAGKITGFSPQGTATRRTRNRP